MSYGRTCYARDSEKVSMQEGKVHETTLESKVGARLEHSRKSMLRAMQSH